MYEFVYQSDHPSSFNPLLGKDNLVSDACSGFLILLSSQPLLGEFG